MVTGSVTSTMPVSTSTVATPIVPCPHIGRQPDTSMNSTPKSASGRVGGCRIAPLIAECPRGSYISSVRRWSRCSRKYRRRSAIVSPGITPTPPVITRVGMPSVCESTAWKTRFVRIASGDARGSAPAPAGRDRGLRVAAHPASCSAVSGSRGGRHGPPYRPTMSIDSLIAWTNSVLESQRSSGCSWR